MRAIVIVLIGLVNSILIGLTFSKNTEAVFFLNQFFYCWYLISSLSFVSLLFLKLQSFSAIAIFLLDCFLLSRLARVLNGNHATVGLMIVFVAFMTAWIAMRFKK